MNNKERCQILFVDPDESWLRFVMETLRDKGIKVKYATDISKAERKLKLVLGTQLVFVDIEFVEHTAAQFQRFVETSNRYVVVLSPTDLTPYRMSRIFRLGVYDCVNKPYNGRSLVRLIESLAEEINFLPCNGASSLVANHIAA